MWLRICLVASGLAWATTALAAPKNVVLFVADDLGTTLGCYGDRGIKTSAFDALAADGTLFTHAFATTASCSPSRSVILSGMFNHANGQYGLEHDVHHFRTFDRVKTLSARLGGRYRTVRVGKFHVGPPEVYPFETVVPGNPRNGVEMADHCRAFVAADDPRPFFLYFCTADPHRSGQFETSSGANLFGNEGRHPGAREERYEASQVTVPSFLPDTPTCRAELAQYYQSVSRVDQGLGRLMQILKDCGHWDDTLFIAISDNGMPFPGAKTNAYDPGLRLPCVVRNPYVPKRGVRSTAMISWVDIAPTILEFAGAEFRGTDLHGRSFLEILDQAGPRGWDEIYASHTLHEVTMYYPMRVVRTRRHKLIWNIAHPLPFPFASDLWRSPTWQETYRKGPEALYGRRTVAATIHRPQFELYDLEQDPDEAVNRAGDAAYAATLAELKDKIKTFQQRTADPWILKWDYE